MKYHNITTDDMKNGDGLRTVLWVSGCEHHCKGCHNPITWDPDDGLPFTEETMIELLNDLNKDYISGLTLSGGDPLYKFNLIEILNIVKTVKNTFPNKTIWMYTGYVISFDENSLNENSIITEILKYIDVLVDGPFIEELKDSNYHWAGSTNQRVIDVKKSLESKEIILYGSN